MADIKKTMQIDVTTTGTDKAKQQFSGVENSIGSMAKKIF